MSNNSNFYAFPRGAIKEEEAAVNISKKRRCLHRKVTYFLLNKISSGYDNQLGCVLCYYIALQGCSCHFNKQIPERYSSTSFAIIYNYYDSSSLYLFIYPVFSYLFQEINTIYCKIRRYFVFLQNFL